MFILDKKFNGDPFSSINFEFCHFYELNLYLFLFFFILSLNDSYYAIPNVLVKQLQRKEF